MSVEIWVIILLFVYILISHYYEKVPKPPETMITYLPPKIAIPLVSMPDPEVYQYEQVGYLYSGNGGTAAETTFGDGDMTVSSDRHTYDTMIPLYGKINKENWNYYIKTDRIYNIKVPLNNKGFDCGGVNGCPELLEGDQVYMLDLNKVFTVRLFRKGGFGGEETH